MIAFFVIGEYTLEYASEKKPVTKKTKNTKKNRFGPSRRYLYASLDDTEQMQTGRDWEWSSKVSNKVRFAPPILLWGNVCLWRVSCNRGNDSAFFSWKTGMLSKVGFNTSGNKLPNGLGGMTKR